jgi:uncharacterized protein YdeI (YjbR/CyaY-like superfamily)
MIAVSHVDEYLESAGKWQEALKLLRDIFLSCGLEETIKWGGPVYLSGGKNLAAMAAFKSYAGIWFYQGVLLKDEAGKLINAQEGVTRSLRQWRFDSVDQIIQDRDLIKAYVFEAMDNALRTREIKRVRNSFVQIPPALTMALEADQNLRSCFEAFTPGNQKDFCAYIDQAKQEKTKQERLLRIIPMILRGEGLNDKYKKQ